MLAIRIQRDAGVGVSEKCTGAISCARIQTTRLEPSNRSMWPMRKFLPSATSLPFNRSAAPPLPQPSMTNAKFTANDFALAPKLVPLRVKLQTCVERTKPLLSIRNAGQLAPGQWRRRSGDAESRTIS